MVQFMDAITTIAAVILKIVIIVVAGLVIASVVAKVIRRSKRLDETAKNFFANFASVAIKILTLITALMALGIPAATFVTVLGSVGLAVGLALQGALANFAGGILLVVFRPFRIGDHVTLSGTSGIVQNISIFYTTLLADDNTVVTLPNGTLTNANIVNTSINGDRRLCLEYGLASESDVEAARAAVIDAANKNASVLKGIAPAVTVSTHVEGKITLKLTVWTRSADYAKASEDLNKEVEAALDAAKVTRA